MGKFDLIRKRVEQICNQAVSAVERFYKLTDLDPSGMPESFMASFVFDRLGDDGSSANGISMAPEITISTLWRWNESAHGRNSPVLPEELEARQRRIDLVLFKNNSRNKSEQGFLALVEFKRNWNVSGDIQKVRDVLSLIDTCQFGVACGLVNPDRYPGWLEQERRDAAARGEEFVKSRTCSLEIDGQQQNFVVFAHLFERT